MNASRHLHFEWDQAKAMSNEYKHSVRFTLAVSVFRDPGIRTRFDEDHSAAEERWIALGMAATGVLLVVVYTWTEVDQENVNVRIISAPGLPQANRALTRIRYEHQSRRYEPEYDFGRAQRGRHFAGTDAAFRRPVYLEQDVQAFLMEKAARKGVPLDRLVNDLLKGDIEAFRKLAEVA